MRSNTAKAIILTLVCCSCLLILQRNVIANGFSILPGDKYDNVLVTAILEHWYRVFTKGADWTDASYFYPYTKTIAQTDAMFLNGLIYTPFRIAGYDYFISNYLSAVPLKIIGFFGLYALCRKLQVGFFWAVFAAAAFTLSNNMTVHSPRIQLATVALAPLQTILFWNAIDALLSEKKRRLLGYGSAAFLLLGAWCMTCFYMAWFFCFLFLATLISLVVLKRDATVAAAKSALKLKKEIAFLAVVALFSITPFLYVFLPKSYEAGVRSYEEALPYTVRLPDILQVGEENLLFGGIYNRFLKSVYPAYAANTEYYNTGFNFVLFALFVAAGLWSWRNVKPILLATLIATCVTWVFVLRVGSISPWVLVFYSVPGAKAMRVISAYQILLTVPVIVIIVKYLSKRTIDPAIAVILAAVLLLGELNTEPLGLDRKAELARVANVPSPPAECQSFFVTAWADQGKVPELAFLDGLYAHNASAMMIAQQVGIPTINGFASFNPTDWNFAKPKSPDYTSRVSAYIDEHELSFVCKLDLNNKQWTTIASDAQDIGSNKIDFTRVPDPRVLGRISGLSGVEPWGRWSDSAAVNLKFRRPLPEKFKLHLTAHAFGPNVGQNFTVQIGDALATFVVPATFEERTMLFSNPGQANSIHITIPDPVSPQQLGLNNDPRKIGLALQNMWVEEIAPLEVNEEEKP